MGKIKIIHILQAVGGVEVHLRLLLANLDPKKFENILIIGEGDTENPFLGKNNQPVKVYRTKIERKINPMKDFVVVGEINKIIKKEKPQLIHAHSAKGGIFGKLAGWMREIPVLHTPHAYSYLSAETGAKRKLFLKIEKFFSRGNNKILACSNSERMRAINDVGYKSENALLFNNSIEPIEEIEPLSIRKSWPTKYLCTVGRPSYQKNIEFMIRIIKEIKEYKPDIHLVIMGVGFHSPNLENVKNLINELQLQKNISLLPWTKREDIFNIIKHAQLYISTARYEGLPYSIIEALALKKACVVTDADGNRDLVENGKNGYVIKNENEDAFAQKLVKILNDEQLRLDFENYSFKQFNAHFNIHNTIGLLEEIYTKNAKS